MSRKELIEELIWCGPLIAFVIGVHILAVLAVAS